MKVVSGEEKPEATQRVPSCNSPSPSVAKSIPCVYFRGHSREIEQLRLAVLEPTSLSGCPTPILTRRRDQKRHELVGHARCAAKSGGVASSASIRAYPARCCS